MRIYHFLAFPAQMCYHYNKHFKADEIRKIIGKNGVEYLIVQIGLYAYEVLQQKLIAGEPEFTLKKLLIAAKDLQRIC